MSHEWHMVCELCSCRVPSLFGDKQRGKTAISCGNLAYVWKMEVLNIMSDTLPARGLTADLFDPVATMMDKFWAGGMPLMADRPFPEGGLVHHYTTVEAAISIIEKQRFWSTNIAFLNDFNERVCALNVLTNIIEAPDTGVFKDEGAKELARQLVSTIKDQYVHATFVTSFCDSGDMLGQWRGYGGGVSIAFDAEELDAAFDEQTSLVRVLYRPAEQSEIFDRMIVTASSWLADKKDDDDFENIKWEGLSRLRVYFENISAKMKNMSFYDEREWRLLTKRDISPLTDRPEVHFRARGKAISPYIELDPNNGKLPIRGITLSPNSHSSAGSSFQAILHKYGYEDVLVNNSTIPYRD